MRIIREGEADVWDVALSDVKSAYTAVIVTSFTIIVTFGTLSVWRHKRLGASSAKIVGYGDQTVFYGCSVVELQRFGGSWMRSGELLEHLRQRLVDAGFCARHLFYQPGCPQRLGCTPDPFDCL